jgi:hypothetical protein
MKIPVDFDWQIYLKLNPDIYSYCNTEESVKLHYLIYGYYENRKYEEQKVVLPTNFDWQIYLKLNPDIYNYCNTEESVKLHYLIYGYYENRKYEEQKVVLPADFDWQIYLKLNPDIYSYCNTEESVKLHYLIYGYYENRKYEEEQYINCKEKFRNICIENLSYIKNINLPNFSENSDFESVLIEYRCMPHLEFLIRNTIIKLGEKWCHTIICGNLNYEFMINICSTISNKINIIKTNYDNLFPSDYSLFLSSLNFWNLLKGKKILIYQEDSIIFKTNIDDFLHFDYIGAPWPEHQNDNKNGVGNGGISLRTKDIMIQIINTINIFDTQYNSSTLEYMKNTNSTVPPEDIYFSKNIEDLNIGLLADRISATNFSTESIFNNNSFAGHNFWLNDPNWIKRIFNNNIIQLKPEYDVYINHVQHRGGWKDILYNLKKNNIFNISSNIHFFDTIEIYFLLNNYICNNKWCGIIHWTPNTPDYLNIINIDIMFSKENFIKSLNNCIFLVSLSKYLTKYIEKKLKELNKDIKVFTFKHPIQSIEKKYEWSYYNYINNDNKILLQIGQQLRKVSSIYLVNSLNFKKLWLSGNKDIKYSNYLLDNEIKYLNLDKEKLDKNVEIYYTNTYEEYDNLLSKNIVFINLYDAGANNTILECIIRNTPIIVNKIEPVIEYLGEDYPLYFNNIEEVPNLLNYEQILKAHQYLCNMNKDDIDINFFNKNIINCLYNNNNN